MSTLFFCLYAIFTASIFFSVSKAQALFLNILCCIAGGIYFLSAGGYAGAIGLVICGLGSLYQLYISIYYKDKEETKAELIFKLVGCTVFTAAGVWNVYQSPNDILVVAAIIAGRSGEMFEDSRKVKLGYVLFEALFLLYAANSGFLGLFAVHLSTACIGLLCLYIKPKHIANLKQRIISTCTAKALPA